MIYTLITRNIDHFHEHLSIVESCSQFIILNMLDLVVVSPMIKMQWDVPLTKIFLCICSCWVGGNSNPIFPTLVIPNVYPNFNKLPTNIHVTFLLYKCSNLLICWYLVKHLNFSQFSQRMKTCNQKRMYKDGHHKLGQIFNRLVHFSPMYVGILFGFFKLYVYFSCEYKHFHCSNLICMVW